METLFDDKWQGWAYADVETFPSGALFHTMAFTGSFGWTLPSEKVRLYSSGSKVALGSMWALEPDLARLYLQAKYKNRRGARITRDQINYFSGRRYHAPVFAIPAEMDEAVYIDIKSAYWQILTIVGWDVDYKPGSFLGVKSSVQDFPFPQHKVARSALVTSALPSTMAYWNKGRHFQQATINHNLNTQLWALVCDVLNGVANDLLKVNCVYANTDGFIVPNSQRSAALEIINSWGLQAAVKREGRCKVHGVGSYEFGTFRTKKVDRQKPKAHYGIQDVVERKKLRKRFSKFSALGRLYF